MSSRLTTLSFGLLLAAGCGSVTTETTPTGSTGSGGSTSASTGSGVTGESYTVKFGPVKVASGAEHTQCMTLRLGNPAAIHVGKIHNVLSEGSHHVIVYRTNDTVEQTVPYDCQPFAGTLKPKE